MLRMEVMLWKKKNTKQGTKRPSFTTLGISFKFLILNFSNCKIYITGSPFAMRVI